MAGLTPKRERFVLGLVAGKTQRQAYIDAGYSTKNMSEKAVDTEASRLFKNPKVFQRYQELMEEHKEKSMFDRESILAELTWIYKQGKESVLNHDEGYVRQGTSNAMLGALDRIIQLELLDPIQRMEYEKLKKEIEPDAEQEDKLVAFADRLEEVFKDED